ncbi:Axin-1 isoform 2 [Schistosoma japonicum]|uniref:Axin-1 isoform 2 n=1 Tax=Schistosoma japonicum TaxID=6182 RepID=A0A4Z2DPS4_SCHJA|nr:Axin-1 isoform 2 [Schistosoma japonicum]
MDVVVDSRDSANTNDQSRWSLNLDNLLDDSDGVEFFNKFLSYKHSASHLLDFWFACKGFRSNADLSNSDKLFQVAKVIYRTYIKSGALHAVPLPYILKQNIHECLSSYHHGYKNGLSSDDSVQPPDRCLFDSAQNVVKGLLEQKYYPEFLSFIACPSNLLFLTPSEPFCFDKRTRNKYLDFLYSEQKLNVCRSNRAKHKLYSHCNRFSADQSPGAKNYHNVFNTDYYLPNNNYHYNVSSVSEQISINPFIRLTTSWTSSTIQSPLIHSAQPQPDHQCDASANPQRCRSTNRHQLGSIHDRSGFVSKMPATINDCMLTDNHLQQTNDNILKDTISMKQQCDDTRDNPSQLTNHSFQINHNSLPGNESNQKFILTSVITSLPVTTTTTTTTTMMMHPIPALNNVNFPMSHSSNLQSTNQSDLKKESNNNNNNNNNNQPKIHSTVRKQTNLAETDPVSFVQLLTDRLEKVKESRGKLEKLMSLVNHQVDEKHFEESGHTLGGQSFDSHGLISYISKHNPSFHADNINWSQLKPNSLINTTTTTMNETNSSTMQHQHITNYPHNSILITNTDTNLLNVNKSQDAQEILDDHCSRIWADESDVNTDTQLLLSSKRRQNDFMHTSSTSSQQSIMVTPNPPVFSDTFVHSTKHGLVRSGSSVTEYELRKLPGQNRASVGFPLSTTGTCVSSNNNISMNRTAISDSSHRRRHITPNIGNGSYRSFCRPNKSDVRSTASWDSGVTSNYEKKQHFLYDDLDYLDTDTASILEAASLQALSSSTTELALVNGEVTAKLVEKIIRHYPRRIFDGDSSSSSKNHTSGQSKETTNVGYEYPYRLRRNKHSDSCYESCYPMHSLNSSSACSTCQQQQHSGITCECYRCVYCAHSNEHSSSSQLLLTNCCNNCNQLNDKLQHSTSCRTYQQFPVASDTSSTFDSGISSAYDQLPLKKQVNNRENRSKSLHNWQTNPSFKDTHLSTPRGNRTHSESKSVYDDTITNNNDTTTAAHMSDYPPSTCLVSSCYEFNSKQTTPGQICQHGINGLHSCDSCSTHQHHYHHYPNPHHHHHPYLLHPPYHRHSHCPEVMISDLNSKYSVNDCKKPSSGKLLQHWLQLQQNPLEKCHPSVSTSEQKTKCSSDNAVLVSNDNSQGQISKNGKESSSHGRKSHHHHHHHGHRKSSTHHVGQINLNNNSNNNNNNSLHFGENDDFDENNTSIRLDSKLSSSVMTSASSHTTTTTTTTTTGSSGPGLVVGYYLCDDPVPYRTVWTGPTNGGSHNPPPSSSSGLFVEVNDQSESVDNFQTKLSNQSMLTLGQFKQLIAKKGVYRYFFKKPNDEFGTGVVHEELTSDNAILPLWEGKVVARVERAD